VANNFSGEILHCGATRFRVTGSGNLQLFLRSLDNSHNLQLTSIPMQATTNKEPLVLSNFSDQRVQLELRTTEINEVFNVSKIVVFIKPVATGYPQ